MPLRCKYWSHKCLSASTFTVLYWWHNDRRFWGHKCLSASTFTVPLKRQTRVFSYSVTNAYRQVHLLYRGISPADKIRARVTNAYRQVHLLYHPQKGVLVWTTNPSQMPIGKYIYCTECNRVIENPKKAKVTNAYRQVHLLYNSGDLVEAWWQKSQMPIGKYIYCTPR